MELTESLSKIRPKAVDDISSWILFEKKDGDIYCIGSLKKDSYIEAGKNSCAGIMTAIQYFNGTYTLVEIEKQLLGIHNMKIDLIKLYNLLSKASLLENGDASLREKQELDLLSIKLFEVDISRLGRILSVLVKLIFPYGLILSLPVLVSGTIAIMKSISMFITPQSYQIANSYVLGILISFCIFSINIGLHELGHMTVAYKYGLVPSKLVCVLYMGIMPMIYLKIPGIYTLEPGKRIKIWIAGCFVNFSIACAMMLFIPFTNSGLVNLLTMITIVNTSMVITNASPFMPLDGYFVMSTLLKKPNLRKGAFKEFKKFALRKKNNFKGVVIFYFIVSTVFFASALLSQLVWVVRLAVGTYCRSHSILQTLMELKFIGILILIITAKQIVNRRLKNRDTSKKTSPVN